MAALKLQDSRARGASPGTGSAGVSPAMPAELALGMCAVMDHVSVADMAGETPALPVPLT